MQMTSQNSIIFIICLIIWVKLRKEGPSMFIYKNTIEDDADISYNNYKLYGKSDFITLLLCLMSDITFMYILFWNKEIYYLFLVGCFYCLSQGFKYLFLNNNIYLKDLDKEISLIINLNIFNNRNYLKNKIIGFKMNSLIYEKTSIISDIDKCNDLFFNILNNHNNILFVTQYGFYKKEDLPNLFEKLLEDYPKNNIEQYNEYKDILKKIYFSFYKKNLD